MKGRVWGGEFDASWTKSGRETGAQGFIFTQGKCVTGFTVTGEGIKFMQEKYIKIKLN